VGVALLDVAQMPLTVEGGSITGLGEHLGDSNLLAAHPMHLKQHTDVVHTAADRKAAGGRRCATGSAANFRIHAGEENALFSHGIQTRRIKPSDLLDRGNTHITEGRIIPHNVDNVRRRAVFFL